MREREPRAVAGNSFADFRNELFLTAIADQMRSFGAQNSSAFEGVGCGTSLRAGNWLSEMTTNRTRSSATATAPPAAATACLLLLLLLLQELRGGMLRIKRFGSPAPMPGALADTRLEI